MVHHHHYYLCLVNICLLGLYSSKIFIVYWPTKYIDFIILAYQHFTQLLLLLLFKQAADMHEMKNTDTKFNRRTITCRRNLQEDNESFSVWQWHHITHWQLVPLIALWVTTDIINLLFFFLLLLLLLLLLYTVLELQTS